MRGPMPAFRLHPGAIQAMHYAGIAAAVWHPAFLRKIAMRQCPRGAVPEDNTCESAALCGYSGQIRCQFRDS